MPSATLTLSSPGVTSASNVNGQFGGKPISVAVIPGSSTQNTDFTIQYTLDDISLVKSSLVVWSGVYVSTALGIIGQPATHFTSTGSFPDGVSYSFLSPVAGLRLSSTAISSGSITMKVLQGEGW